MVINIMCYIVLFIGIWLLVGRVVTRFIKRIFLFKRLRTLEKKDNKLFDYLDNLIFVTTGAKNKGKLFFAFSVLLFTIGMLCIGRYSEKFGRIFLSAMVAIIPYLLLCIRLEKQRKKGSIEGETLVADVLSKYRIYQGNIDSVLENIVLEERFRISCRLFSLCLSKIRQTGEKEDIMKAAECFSYGIKTNWASMLAFNIGICAAEGVDITNGLEDIVIQMREARRIYEERKRLNAETGRLILVAVPLSYVITTIFSIKYLGVDFSSLVKLQFSTAQGLFLILLAVFLFIANILILSIIKNRNFDY